MSRLYAVGDRKSGVLLVRTEPFRAVMVDEETIGEYARTVGKDYDTVFGEIAGWATGFAAGVPGDEWEAKRNFVDGGPAPRDAAFAVVADTAADQWEAKRNFVDGGSGEADFCVVTDIADGEDWDAKRNFVDIQPIASALDAIVRKPKRAAPQPHVDLEGFVGRDLA